MVKEIPKIEISDPQLEAIKLFRTGVTDVSKSFNTLLFYVIGVMLIGFLVLLFSVAAMVIQSWNFNSSFNAQMQQLKIQEENIRNTVNQQRLMLDVFKKIENRLQNIEKNEAWNSKTTSKKR